MPTGYTATLMDKGEPFQNFALRCARAFGALVMMRDDPMDAPIPTFEPSQYSLVGGEQAKALREHLLSMTDEDRIVYGQAEKEKEIAMLENLLVTETVQNARLLGMRDEVTRWNPPTQDHVGLKDFMLQQIKVSLGTGDYYQQRIRECRAKFARDYYDKAVEKATHDIEYHEKAYREELERTASRNRWITELRASLPTE